jgi:hypothetical protein
MAWNNNNNNNNNNDNDNNNEHSRDLRKARVQAIVTAATTTSRLKLCRESFLLWRRAVHAYCRSAFDTDIGTGPGWTLTWQPVHDEDDNMDFLTWFNKSYDDDLYDFVSTTSDPAHEQPRLLICQDTSLPCWSGEAASSSYYVAGARGTRPLAPRLTAAATRTATASAREPTK